MPFGLGGGWNRPDNSQDQAYCGLTQRATIDCIPRLPMVDDEASAHQTARNPPKSGGAGGGP